MSRSNKYPLVSVVIPSYNHAKYIEDSIQSIIDQDYQNIELIIIDDGSKDNSIAVIEGMISACKDRFLRFEFRHRFNKGLCATLNEALEWCKGDYFSPIASDDIALPHKISFLVSKIENTNYSAVFGNIQYIGDQISIVNSTNNLEHSFSDLFIYGNSLAAPAALMKTEDIRNIGGYEENLALEDWSMWLKLAYEGKRLISYNRVVTLYRRHEGNTVNNVDFMYSARKQVIDMYRHHYLYKVALKRNLYLKARGTAHHRTLQPIILLIKSGYFYKPQGCIVLVKAFTPRVIIDLLKKNI